MPTEPGVDPIDREASRVITRLETMPLSKVSQDVIEMVRIAAEGIVMLTPDPDRPSDATMPSLGPTALAAQVLVTVHDYLDKRTAASNDAAVAQILTELRRSLP
jgi:hypothetical protein